MKNSIRIIPALLLCIFCLSCNNSENKKAQSIYEQMSTFTGSPISNQLPDINRTYEYETKDTVRYSGFSSLLKSKDEGYKFVLKEKKNFKEHGYQLFYFEDNDHKFYLGAIKSDDEMDILRWRGTDGINYDHTNQDIINKLEEWSKSNPIDVVGVSYDWVLFHFENPVKDVKELAEDVYEFCPDVIDQGVGTMDALKHFIKEENGVYLWWD